MTFSRQISRQYLFLTILFCTVFAFAAPASAHDTGFSYIATSSPYVIDIGYDPVAYVAGQSVRFDFVLRDEKSGQNVSFDQVWVRVTNENNTKLATGLFRQPFGPTTLLYVFAPPGEYTLEASFRDVSGHELAVSSFPMVVLEGDSSSLPIPKYAVLALVFIAGSVFGVLGGRMMLKKRRTVQ